MISKETQTTVQLFLELPLAEKKYIQNAMESVRNEGVSNYPIVVIFENPIELELGFPIGLNKEKLNINISTLEELFVKNIVESEKVNNFRDIYKHKIDHFCVLMLEKENQEFVFVPYD